MLISNHLRVNVISNDTLFITKRFYSTSKKLSNWPKIIIIRPPPLLTRTLALEAGLHDTTSKDVWCCTHVNKSLWHIRLCDSFDDWWVLTYCSFQIYDKGRDARQKVLDVLSDASIYGPTRFSPSDGTPFNRQIELNTKNSTKRRLTTPFGWVFGVQLGLWQMQVTN